MKDRFKENYGFGAILTEIAKWIWRRIGNKVRGIIKAQRIVDECISQQKRA